MKTIYKITIIHILLIGIFPDFASATDLDTLKSRYSFSAGYSIGIKSDDGFHLGIDRYVFENNKFQVMQNASLFLQQRSDVYTSLTITTGSTLRRNYKCGFYFDHALKLGYAGHYYHFDVYETNSEDEIVNVGHQWTSSFVAGYSFAVGYNFSRIIKQDIRIFAGPNIYLKFPNNDNLFLLNNYNLQIGMVFRPTNNK